MDTEGDLAGLTERVPGAVFEVVSNTLAAGFLEKVYERALLRELALRGISVVAQASFAVSYNSQSVGECFADILVEDVRVVEWQCVDRLGNEHTAQCLNRFPSVFLCVPLWLMSWVRGGNPDAPQDTRAAAPRGWRYRHPARGQADDRRAGTARVP
jgi:GxxExxY protein